MLQITLSILVIVITALFLGYDIKLTGEIPRSLSKIVLDIPYKAMWTFYMWLCALLMGIALAFVLPEQYTLMNFGMVACLILCGGFPLIIEEAEKFHTIMGIVGGIFSQICVAIINPWLLLFWILYGLLCWWKKSSAVLWSEIVCFLSTCLCVILESV